MQHEVSPAFAPEPGRSPASQQLRGPRLRRRQNRQGLHSAPKGRDEDLATEHRLPKAQRHIDVNVIVHVSQPLMRKDLHRDKEVSGLAPSASGVSSGGNPKLHQISNARRDRHPDISGLWSDSFATARPARMIKHLPGAVATVAGHAHAQDAALHALNSGAAADPAGGPGRACLGAGAAAVRAGLLGHQGDHLLAALHCLQEAYLDLRAHVLASGRRAGRSIEAVHARSTEDVVELGEHLGRIDPILLRSPRSRTRAARSAWSRSARASDRLI
mmetsp:Transcript_39846/g.86980  ORF Transcript_39846/g.86980 Transcript_39846/m.86980 type:complete len:273 (-) Transcript_39846:356-1174(-)